MFKSVDAVFFFILKVWPRFSPLQYGVGSLDNWHLPRSRLGPPTDLSDSLRLDPPSLFNPGLTYERGLSELFPLKCSLNALR